MVTFMAGLAFGIARYPGGLDAAKSDRFPENTADSPKFDSQTRRPRETRKNGLRIDRRGRAATGVHLELIQETSQLCGDDWRAGA
jgi:hypothetical protein